MREFSKSEITFCEINPSEINLYENDKCEIYTCEIPLSEIAMSEIAVSEIPKSRVREYFLDRHPAGTGTGSVKRKSVGVSTDICGNADDDLMKYHLIATFENHTRIEKRARIVPVSDKW